MTAADVINEELGRRGMYVTQLAGATGITYENLRVALCNQRNIRAEELILICRALGLDLSDFDEV